MNPQDETPSEPKEIQPFAEDDLLDLSPQKNWVDELAWYLLVMGFIGILLAGVLFYMHPRYPLRYEDFHINAKVLGGYVLIAGVSSYFSGRILTYIRRMQRKKASS
jgi:hypothetical protein